MRVESELEAWRLVHGQPRGLGQPPCACGAKALTNGWTTCAFDMGTRPSVVLPMMVLKRQLTGHRAVTLSAWAPHVSQQASFLLRSAACTRPSAQLALTSLVPFVLDSSRHQQRPLLEPSGLHSPGACVEYQLPSMRQASAEIHRSYTLLSPITSAPRPVSAPPGAALALALVLP